MCWVDHPKLQHVSAFTLLDCYAAVPLELRRTEREVECSIGGNDQWRLRCRDRTAIESTSHQFLSGHRGGELQFDVDALAGVHAHFLEIRLALPPSNQGSVAEIKNRGARAGGIRGGEFRIARLAISAVGTSILVTVIASAIRIEFFMSFSFPLSGRDSQVSRP